MTDAATILAQYGNHDPQSTITAAALEHIDLAVAATMLEKESNGRNVWGSDPGSTGGAYIKGSTVTKADYLAYRALVQAGRIGRQGVGPAQCTSAGYQNTADQLGGCWDPVANMRSGFRGLGALIRTYGLRDGARRYNGSGPMADRYAADFMTKYSAWRSRLAGASIPTPTEGDDMAAVPQSEWNDVHAALTALLKPWPGGVSDKEPAKLEDPDVAGYNLVQYLLRNNVEIHRSRAELASLTTKVDTLAASVAGLAARQA